jgi:hypothetical protein
MTNAFLQQIIVVAIVLGALGFIVAKVVRAVQAARSKRAAACASGCGCAPAAAPTKDPVVQGRR